MIKPLHYYVLFFIFEMLNLKKHLFHLVLRLFFVHKEVFDVMDIRPLSNRCGRVFECISREIKPYCVFVSAVMFLCVTTGHVVVASEIKSLDLRERCSHPTGHVIHGQISAPRRRAKTGKSHRRKEANVKEPWRHSDRTVRRGPSLLDPTVCSEQKTLKSIIQVGGNRYLRLMDIGFAADGCKGMKFILIRTSQASGLQGGERRSQVALTASPS